MTPTGITTTLLRNSKSYEANNEQRVTRIEVSSDKLKMVKNARYRHPLNDVFFKMFNGLNEHYKTTLLKKKLKEVA